MANIRVEDVEPRRVSQVGLKALGRALLRHKLSIFGLSAIAVLVLMAIFAPLIAPYSPTKQDLYHVLAGPSKAHWLGTDNVGRDLLSRVIYGSRVSLVVGVSAAIISAFIGTVLGLVAGFRGGFIDAAIMRITDTFMVFPFLVFVLAMAAALGPGVMNIVIALVVLGWTGFARIIRGQVLVVRELPYVESARAAGASSFRIMLRHVLPNSVAPIIVAFSISVGLFIMVESGTAFLGLGVQPPTPSWGRELRVGYTYLERNPLFSFAPGLMITLSVLAFNFVGDGLRDAMDPRLRGER